MKSAVIVDYDPKKQLEQVVRYYLESNPIVNHNGVANELEVRFGTDRKKPITKIDYENVIKQLHAVGFKTENPQGVNMLRITPEIIQPGINNGTKTRMSNVRVEINGSDTIQNYCKTNDLSKILKQSNTRDYKVGFLQKMSPKLKERISDGDYIKPVDFSDFHFRVSYQLEQELTAKNDLVKPLIQNWLNSKKNFRYINRVRFSHPDMPLFADISIVKGNKKTSGGADNEKKKISVPYKTLQEAGIFETAEWYEIELEIDNERIGLTTQYNTVLSLIDLIKRGVRIVLSGLQKTAFPVSYKEQEQILNSYMTLLHGETYKPRRIYSSDFIGPQSMTLQSYNVCEISENNKMPNIRKNYCVTDKADGERKLLFVNSTGAIYLIDTNMNVIFTGTKTAKKELQNSLIDGEHIKYDKTGKYINLYAAFDLYYFNGKSVRELAFWDTADDFEKLMAEALSHKKNKNLEEDEIPKIDPKKYRLYLLREVIKHINPQNIGDKGDKRDAAAAQNTQSCGFIIKCKKFYSEKSEKGTIFDACSVILTQIKDGSNEYNSDGLIFTPCFAGVGSDREGVAGKLRKTQWDLSFKWKPPQYNTIDFLVKIKRDKTGKEEIHTIFEEGVDLTSGVELKKYKVIELLCGFDEKIHGYLNPAETVIQHKIPRKNGSDTLDDENPTYKPVCFIPTNPYDPTACYANIDLHLAANNHDSFIMKTEEGEYFEESMIVEFAYDINRPAGWCWVPLRVRNDKTAELRSGIKNYGNSYIVANNNWQSIHNPITEEMIMSGDGFNNTAVNSTANDDVYYNREETVSNKSITKALRNFHNLYIKKKLISGVSSTGDTLIDYAVGKGGDLSKWIHSNLGFVLGLDVNRDNIHNRLDGAYARYLNELLKYNKIPRALFVVGNSSHNIREGKAVTTEKDASIINAVFGKGKKDRGELGEGVYLNYGVAADGFDISSCQFALHYFFEGLVTLHSFMRNLAECTKIGGYFIGTCFDGRTIFDLLKKKAHGESVVVIKEDTKIFELTKMYHEQGFTDDENSLGFGINVFQESINKVFREYLVNFQFLKKIMDNYGFVLISNKDAQDMGFANSTGLFEEMFNQLEDDLKHGVKNESGLAAEMSEEEKKISFLNRYFIFKKMRDVDAEKVYLASSGFQKSIDIIVEDYNEDYNAAKFSKKIITKEKAEEEKMDAAAETKKAATSSKKKNCNN